VILEIAGASTMVHGLRNSALAAMLAFLVLPGIAQARNCTRAEAADGDRWTRLSQRDHDGSIVRNLPWGVPVPTGPTTNEHLVVLTEYVNLFDDDLLIPLWSAEQLVARQPGPDSGRINCFRPNPRVLPQSDLKNDYDEEIHDQGHLTPSEDQSGSVRANVNTFFYTNMTPQIGRFNQVTWNRLEATVRRWVRTDRPLYVITGAVLDRDGDGRRDADADAPRMQPRHNRPARVAIPSHFYKIIAYRQPNGRLATLSVLLPHDGTPLTGRDIGRLFERHVTTVAAIEQLTGLDFFPAGPGLDEETEFCRYAGGSPRSLCGP
jgi:DNA/RNA endonuclease G (NUC1)